MNMGRYGGYYHPLSTNDVRAVHRASMQVLEQAGFRVDNPRALEKEAFPELGDPAHITRTS